MVRFHM